MFVLCVPPVNMENLAVCTRTLAAGYSSPAMCKVEHKKRVVDGLFILGPVAISTAVYKRS